MPSDLKTSLDKSSLKAILLLSENASIQRFLMFGSIRLMD